MIWDIIESMRYSSKRWYIVFHGSYSQGKSQNSFFLVGFLEKETQFFRFDRSIKTNLLRLLFVFHVFFCFSCFFHCVHPFWDLSVLQKHVWARVPFVHISPWTPQPASEERRNAAATVSHCLSHMMMMRLLVHWLIKHNRLISLVIDPHLRREVKLTTVSSKIYSWCER